MSDYANTSIEELRKLKERLTSQKGKIDNEISQIVKEIAKKSDEINDETIIRNPYYKDKTCVIKITIDGLHTSLKYTITKIKYNGRFLSVEHFYEQNTSFMRRYETANESDWTNAINHLNAYLNDASIKMIDMTKCEKVSLNTEVK